MKERNWEDSIENSKEYIESMVILPDDGDEDEAAEISLKGGTDKSRATDLRRRIEARLDSKRIAHEFDFDDLDDDDLDDDDLDDDDLNDDEPDALPDTLQ